MKDDTNTTLTFEDVIVKDVGSSAKYNGKKFEDLSIEITSKEIYIGSNFKVKWKQVKDLKIYTTGKKNNDDNGNDSGNGNDKKEEVVYVDDDGGRIGFNLRCFNNKNGKSKKKTDHFRSVILSRRNKNDSNSDDNDEEEEEEDIRVFEICFPIAPPGHRDFVSSWDEFHGTLKRFYDKECKKRKNKLEREEEERQQELKQQKQNKSSSSSSYVSRRGGRRTYSKRTTKFDKFMLNNKANIENNAAIWSDDDDEVADEDNYEINNNGDDDNIIDDTVTNQISKKNKSRERFEEGVEEVTNLWKGQNNDNDNEDISVNDTGNHGDDHDVDDDDDDDDEHEFNDDNDNVEVYGDDDNTVVGDDDDDDGPVLKRKDTTEAKEKESTKKEEKEDNENDDDDDDDSVNNNRSAKPVRKRLKKKKIITASKKRRGPVLDDSEDDDDDDDDEFTFKGEDAPIMLTTPTAAIQRIVSPTTTGMKKLQQKKKQQQKSPRIVEEKDHEKNTTNKEHANQKKQRNAGDENLSQKTKNISSFFQPKLKSKTTTVVTTTTTTTSNSLLDKNNKECIIESATTDFATTNPTKQNDDDETTGKSDVEMDGKKDTKESGGDSVMGDDHDVLMDSDHENVQVVTKNNTLNRKHASKADGANKFFSPQKRLRKQKTVDVDRPSDSTTTSSSSKTSSDDETSTVIGATTQDDIIDVDDDSSYRKTSTKFPRYTPEQNKRLKLAIRSSERRVEDDDPIEEVDSSQSQSPSRQYSSSKRTTTISSSLFPRKSSAKRLKYGSGGGTALKALELADARRNTTPLKLHSRPHDVETNTLSPVRKRLDMGTMTQVQKQHVNSSKWRGLKNYGNSCYVNSSLQQLFSIPLFIESISKNKEGHELVTTLSNLWTSMNPMGKTDEKTLGAASARDVKVVMDKLTDRFKGAQQRDSHEFLGELIDRIHDELSGNEENDASSSVDSNVMSSTASADNDKKGKKLSQDEEVEPVDEFFRWNVQVCLKCKSCGYSRSKEEMYRYLSIDIGDGNFNLRDPNFIQPKVDSCLKRFFSAEDREVNCEKCEEGKIATQTMKILSKPKVMLLHLKRFFMDERQITENDNSTSTEIVLKKNKVPVELTTELSIDKLLANESIETSLPSNEYRLKSIVYHIGNTANSGHYTTDALRKDINTGKDQWVSYDDGVTVEKSIEEVVQQTKNQKTAYMLMYSVD